MKTKTSRILTIGCVLLALVGLGVLLYPTIADAWYRFEARREITSYNGVVDGTGVDYSAYWEAAEEYNRALAAGEMVDATPEYVANYLNPFGTGMMGYLSVPSIDLELPIYQGTGEDSLQSGVGYWLGTSLPTGGESTHCVLTAHTGLSKAKMFTDLEELEIGDQFSLTILDRTMTYEVDQILITEPDDLSALQIVDGEDYVTLYTCTPYGVNTQRLLVRGRRVEDSEVLTDTDTYSANRWLLIPAVLILAAILLVVWRKRRNQKSSDN